MCPAKQVWSDPDVTAFSSHSGGFFLFFFFFVCFGPSHFLPQASHTLLSHSELHRLLPHCLLIF